jgi:autotransporter-associated beta strand protein
VKTLALLLLTFLFLISHVAYADSATWVAESPYYWNSPQNWQPHTVPDSPGDVATFGNSGSTTCTSIYFIDIASVVFTPAAKAFSITIEKSSLSLGDLGVLNQSAVTQNFIVLPYGYPAHLQTITFHNQASAGNLVHYTTIGSSEGDVYGGALIFDDNSNAGTALIDNQQTENTDYGGTNFYGSSSAQHSSITNYAATYSDADGASTVFADTSSAGHATIVNKGATSGDGEGGVVYFEDSSTAAESTITCEASTGAPYYKAAVWFDFDSSGGKSHIKVYGDGTVYTYFRFPDIYPGTITFGSIEGDGHIIVSAYDFGPMILEVGGNNASTTFDGLLEEFSYENGSEASLNKVGSGRLILTNANTYHGATTVESGTLLVNNKTGSGTGSGNVFVTGGTFGGGGTVAGRATVGTGSGSGASLAPGKSGVKPGTLTILKRLILQSDATYRVTVDGRIPAADKVTSYGASVRNASILFNDIGASVIAAGTVFTVLENTATVPTVGTFKNLPDGSTIKVGSNTFQANYEGGDGNDLTLTVVP